MKQYQSIGPLLMDYRKEQKISQIEFASMLHVDIRTVQRWEKDETLIKPEKEKELARATLLPYQLIRNLNTVDPIPTYYDFRIRKYSLSELSNDLPDASWFKDRIKDFSRRVRTIDVQRDMEVLSKDLSVQRHHSKIISRSLLSEAVKLLPELNLIISDDYFNYSGHAIVLPLKEDAYQRLIERKMGPDELTVEDLVSPRLTEIPIFFNYDITADCNDNIFFLAHQYLNYFLELPHENYRYCSYTFRYDTYRLNEKIGLKLLWEDPVRKDELGLDYHPRFYTGDFNDYLSGLKHTGRS